MITKRFTISNITRQHAIRGTIGQIQIIMSGSYLQLITTSWLIVLSLHLLLLPMMVLVVTGFHNNNNLLPTTHRHRHLLLCNQKKSTIRIFNTKNDDDTQPIIENNDNDNDDKKSSSILSPTSSSSSSASSLGEGFNPLDYRRSNTGVLSSTKSTRISVRSVRMAALTNELLNALGDENAIRIILQDNRDFLLEPLEEDDILVVRKPIKSKFKLIFKLNRLHCLSRFINSTYIKWEFCPTD